MTTVRRNREFWEGGDKELKNAGSKPSTVYEYVPGYFRLLLRH